MLDLDPLALLAAIGETAEQLRWLLTRMQRELPDRDLTWYLHDPDMPIRNLEHALDKIIEHVSEVMS